MAYPTEDAAGKSYPPYYDPNGPHSYEVEHALALACESENVWPDRKQWNWQAHNCFWVLAEPIGPVGPVAPPRPPDLPPPGLPPQDVAGAIGGEILQRALDALAAVAKISDEIRAETEKRVREAIPAVAKVMVDIQKQIGDFTKGLIPSTLSLVGAALGGMENLLATFLSSAADIGDLSDEFITAISGNKDGIGGFMMELFVGEKFDLAGEIGRKIADALAPGENDLFDTAARVASFMPDVEIVEI